MNDKRPLQPPLIQDIPSFAKLIQQVEILSALKSAMSIAAPFLKLLGFEPSKLSEILANIEDIRQQVRNLTQLPDRFNEIFAEQGWIVYGLMHVEVAQKALAKAIAGDMDGAESDLVEYHSAETIRWKLWTMRGIEAFRPRMRLAELALADYEAERYHASIPVILALMDGLVNDLHELQKGFFAEGTDLTAWDSIAAHDKGLGVLNKIFQKGRRTTRVEQITIPYRNGILHGMDLGYDNKMVAAKTWGALFAVRDWSLKAEKEELDPPPEEPAPTLGSIVKDLFQHRQSMREIERHIEQWEPRTVKIGAETPAQDKPDQYTEGTPERLLVEYLTYWQQKHFANMAKCLSPKFALSGNDTIPRVRNEYREKILRSFAIESIDDESPAITEITVLLNYDERDEQVEKRFTFRLIYQDEKGSAQPRGMEGARWQLITWIVY